MQNEMRPKDSIQIISDKYLENISNAFRTLYAEEQLSDVTIHCKEGSIKAHKLILAANSPYFCKVFRENRNDHPIVILHGITLDQLQNLMELLYRGLVDVPTNNIEAVSTLVKEFEIRGVMFDQSSSNNVRLELGQNSQTSSPESVHNRDTRYRGQKRVAVDYTYDEDRANSRAASTSSAHSNESRPSKISIQGDNPLSGPIFVKREVSSPITVSEDSIPQNSLCVSEHVKTMWENGSPKLNAWARKQRKFKCHLCPSSFKRSSHLSRHQLVHTGERPYSCNQCEKAFSRHDKLKHHVKKAHEFIPDSMYERIDVDDINDDSEPEITETYSNYQNRGPVNGPSTSSVDYAASPNNLQRTNSPLFTISHITSILEDSFVTPPKKGRGRPRKYPPAPPPVQPLIKRGRGRPKLNQAVIPSPRPRVTNYDLTNLPYGDLNYLTNQANDRSLSEDVVMLEPLIEINTEQSDTSGEASNSQLSFKRKSMTGETPSSVEPATIEPVLEGQTQNNEQSMTDYDSINISEIETKIGLIGECTISVAN